MRHPALLLKSDKYASTQDAGPGFRRGEGGCVDVGRALMVALVLFPSLDAYWEGTVKPVGMPCVVRRPRSVAQSPSPSPMGDASVPPPHHRYPRPYGYAFPSPQNTYPCGPPSQRLQSLFSSLSVHFGMSHASRTHALTASETSHCCIVGNE
jgi:hypothetical protein